VYGDRQVVLWPEQQNSADPTDLRGHRLGRLARIVTPQRAAARLLAWQSIIEATKDSYWH
jgi:hypothetical protein